MDTTDPIPFGLCHCGCGERTAIATRTRIGLHDTCVKGEPRRFLPGHNRKRGPEYIADDHGCWVWQRTCYPNGYGLGWDPDLKEQGLAHRIYYRRLVGPIPDGLHLDHACRNRACVNPDHLEPVTVTENNHRSFFGRRENGQFASEQEAA